MATSNPWTGDFNVRGASLTFTNAENVSFNYYFCLFDFPSSWGSYDGMIINFNGVTEIPYPGGMDYSTTTQYTALYRNLVYYQNMYYYCIKDTIGEFDSTCWLAAGANSYQLNYSWMDFGDGWPGGGEGVTTKTYPLGLYTTGTDPTYHESNGPIVMTSVTCSGSSVAKTGNPSAKRPPVVNLPLTNRNGGHTGTPVYVIFNSATDGSTDLYINVCVNTGLKGFKNHIDFNPGADNVYNGAIASGGPDHPVAAVGYILYDSTFAPIGGVTFNGEPNPPCVFPNPWTANPYNYQL